MKKVLFLFAMGLFFFNSCSNDADVLLEETGVFALQDNEKLNGPGSGVLRNTQGWYIVDNVFPSPNFRVSYSNTHKYINLQIENPFWVDGGFPLAPISRTVGQIQIQYREHYGNGTTGEWYDYNPRKRYSTELYMDTIYDACLDDEFYAYKSYWVHSLNAGSLPSGELQFRLRLFLKSYDVGGRYDATAWNTVSGTISSTTTNNYGWDYYDMLSDTESKVTVPLIFNLSVYVESINNIQSVTVSALNRSERVVSGRSVRFYPPLTTRVEVTPGVPTPFTYTVSVLVVYYNNNMVTKNVNVTHTIYWANKKDDGQTFSNDLEI